VNVRSWDCRSKEKAPPVGTGLGKALARQFKRYATGPTLMVPLTVEQVIAGGSAAIVE
jgi:hypothetical protein